MSLIIFEKEFKSILPACSSQKNDELFSSWLVRLAHDHNLKSHLFCKLIFSNIAIWNRDIDRNASEEIIEIISQKVLTSKQDIRNSLLTSYEGVLFISHNRLGLTKWILPLGIFHRKRKRYGLLYCPSCLKKDNSTPYFRKKWRLSFSVVCPECGCFLLENCPNCFSPIVFFRTGLGKDTSIRPINICFHCNYDLKEAISSDANNELIKMQQYLYNVLNGNEKSFLYPFQYFNVLFQLIKIIKGHPLILKDFYKKFENLNFSQNISNSDKIPFDFLNLDDRIPILYYSYWILQDWPNRFIKFCIKHKLWSATLLKDFHEPPFWFYNVIISNLFISNTNRYLITNYKKI